MTEICVYALGKLGLSCVSGGSNHPLLDASNMTQKLSSTVSCGFCLPLRRPSSNSSSSSSSAPPSSSSQSCGSRTTSPAVLASAAAAVGSRCTSRRRPTRPSQPLRSCRRSAVVNCSRPPGCCRGRRRLWLAQAGRKVAGTALRRTETRCIKIHALVLSSSFLLNRNHGSRNAQSRKSGS